MIQNVPILPPATGGDYNIAHLFSEMQPGRKRSEWEKRMALCLLNSNGKCSSCGAFLAAATLHAAKSTPTAEHPFVRVTAICPKCAR